MFKIRNEIFNVTKFGKQLIISSSYKNSKLLYGFFLVRQEINGNKEEMAPWPISNPCKIVYTEFAVPECLHLALLFSVLKWKDPLQSWVEIRLQEPAVEAIFS